jgi:hypothetical protein
VNTVYEGSRFEIGIAVTSCENDISPRVFVKVIDNTRDLDSSFDLFNTIMFDETV